MFRAPLCPLTGAREYYTGSFCLWYLVIWFSSCRYGVELRGMCPAAARKSDTQPSAPHNTDNLKTKAPNTTGSDHLYNTLELLMMGIVLPETCWACNNICNKYHLLHLIGILFPHYTMFFIIISALHVSGGFSAHHQELIKLFVQPWVLSCCLHVLLYQIAAFVLYSFLLMFWY